MLDAEFPRDENCTEVRAEHRPEYRNRCADGCHIDLENHEQNALGPVPRRVVCWIPTTLIVDGLVNAPCRERDDSVFGMLVASERVPSVPVVRISQRGDVRSSHQEEDHESQTSTACHIRLEVKLKRNGRDVYVEDGVDQVV